MKCPHCNERIPESEEEARFLELRSAMIKDAWDRGCNISLVQALKFSRNIKELIITRNQSHGVGTESFREQFRNIELLLD